ncbi:ferredoxin--NADP reductase [Cyclobacterium qasimii]|uniref:Flavodoxin reductases (Ferredoxin-NADPH reductases) family 1 n=2 Tax=Cyclobacterium qasimii TaxID=1350429 RepID=S7WLA9_9BACT|nr:ferredoxin--NADP reductase [Cyclobacterium qasimii]EPR67514.1 Flavodoxin reductases (ferredoxin-NADPH reductases) family 1 [Cyclobacterium qasimii M12-11B]GEO21746.1 phenylacetic acid degradation protein [Cyclobacterium qasimii]
MLFKLFKNKKNDLEKDDHYLTLRIRETVQETSDTVTIYFDQPDPIMEYLPGQFLTLIVEINGKQERRSYSLSTSPFIDPFPGITVKRLEGGLVSNFVNDTFVPGKRVTVMKPLGHFVSDYHSQNNRKYGMFAGGSGITPVMGIIKSILVNEPKSTVHLLYCSRSQDMIIFDKELKALAEKYPEKLYVTHNLTQPQPGWEGAKGRLDQAKVNEFFTSHFNSFSENQRFFICGPEGMMKTAQESLSELEVKKEFIHSENFHLDKVENIEEESLQGVIDRPIKIVLEGEEYTFDVAPGKTILEAGLDEGLNMPYSCQSGLCTACRGKLLSGEVKMDEDAGLSENEIKEGYILCCSAKPTNSEVKIQID